MPAAPTKNKPIRVIEIVKTARHRPNAWEWGYRPLADNGHVEHYFRVKAGSRNGKVVYTSESFSSKGYAIKAAIREHEGRSKFQYVLEYTDRDGETLITKKIK